MRISVAMLAALAGMGLAVTAFAGEANTGSTAGEAVMVVAEDEGQAGVHEPDGWNNPTGVHEPDGWNNPAGVHEPEGLNNPAGVQGGNAGVQGGNNDGQH